MVVRPNGEVEAGIGERGDDAVARFFHRGVGQADDDDQRVAIAGVDFDFDGISLDAIDRGGTDFGEHERKSREAR